MEYIETHFFPLALDWDGPNGVWYFPVSLNSGLRSTAANFFGVPSGGRADCGRVGFKL